MSPKITEEGLRAIMEPGQTFEVRILHVQRYSGGGRKAVAGGYFDDPATAARAVQQFDKQFPVSGGAYVTFNALNPAVMARCPNRIEFLESSASNSDFIRRRFLMIDIDPDRPSGIPSSDAELDLARRSAGIIYHNLKETWGFPVSVRSGNGIHLLYPVDCGLSEDDGLISACLKRVSQESKAWGCQGVSIGCECHDLARHTKLPGTMSRKGGEMPAQGRVHREAFVSDAPSEPRSPIPRSVLEAFAKPVLDAEEAKRLQMRSHQPQLTGEREQINVGDWLAKFGIEVYGKKPWHGGTMHLLKNCPWKGREPTAFVVEMPEGRIFAGCRHAECTQNGCGWFELRDLFEPGWREARKSQPWFGSEIINERRRKELRLMFREEWWLFKDEIRDSGGRR